MLPHLEEEGEYLQEEAEGGGDDTADFPARNVHGNFLAVKRLVHLHFQLVQLSSQRERKGGQREKSKMRRGK